MRRCIWILVTTTALVLLFLFGIMPNLRPIKTTLNSKAIFCFVIASSPVHNIRVPPLIDTWLPQCDRYEFHTDAPLPYPHVVLHNYTSINETWRKLRLSIRYLYETAMEYDWFVRSCDDTYFIVNNLRRFLVDKNPDMPHFFGMIVPDSYKVGQCEIPAGRGFNSGSGFVLSRGAIKILVEQLFLSPDLCAEKTTSEDDTQIAGCLANAGIYPQRTQDERWKERFHSTHFNEIFARKRDTCSFSETSISFHRLSPNEMRFAHFLIYDIDNRLRR